MNSAATDLARLHDIVAPPPAPLWPPAPGTLILLVLITVALLALLARAFLHWQRNRYRREAAAKLSHATQPAAIAVLLKRTALTAYPRAEVAALTGPAWHAFLDRTASTTVFTTATGPLLARLIYENSTPTPAQTTQLLAAARHWIKKHKAPPSPIEPKTMKNFPKSNCHLIDDKLRTPPEGASENFSRNT